MPNPAVDIAIVGAGIAGLTCARQLQATGRTVIVLDKSRGVGGRMATRRVQEIRVDHGVRYLEAQTPALATFVQSLMQQGLLQVWTQQIHQMDNGQNLRVAGEPYPRYIAPGGMSTIAKHLAADLSLQLGQRVKAITLSDRQTWTLHLDGASSLEAGTVVLTLPAPQILEILQGVRSRLPPEFLQQLGSVTFAPCITAIAGYPPEKQQDLEKSGPAWRSIEFPGDPDLFWVGWDSSKRTNPEQPVFVVHSSEAFATQALETTDLSSVGQNLLTIAARNLLPWLATPLWLQVHRWRYGFPRQSLTQSYLAADDSAPLVCGGDWCGGNQVESALVSGLAIAQYINDTQV